MTRSNRVTILAVKIQKKKLSSLLKFPFLDFDGK